MTSFAYYGLFFGLFFLLLVAAYRSRHIEKVCGILVWLLLTLFSGLRVGPGRDYLIYVDVYTNPFSPTNERIEPLWNIINPIFRDYEIPIHFWFLLIAGITYAFVFYGFRRWHIDWILGILCYVILYQGFFESMNTIRQCLAGAILFCGASNLLERRYITFVLWVLGASLFHSSALIGGVILAVCHIRWSNWLLYVGLLISVITGIYLFPLIIEVLQTTLPGKYTIYLEGEFLTVSNTGLYFVFLSGFALWLIYVLSYNREVASSPRLSLYARMLIISVFIYNVLSVFEPGVRLMRYPFVAVFFFFPLIYRIKEEWIRRSALAFFVGMCAFSFKTLFDPEEPYIRYQTIFEQSVPIPTVPKNVTNEKINPNISK